MFSYNYLGQGLETMLLHAQFIPYAQFKIIMWIILSISSYFHPTGGTAVDGLDLYVFMFKCHDYEQPTHYIKRHDYVSKMKP